MDKFPHHCSNFSPSFNPKSSHPVLHKILGNRTIFCLVPLRFRSPTITSSSLPFFLFFPSFSPTSSSKKKIGKQSVGGHCVIKKIRGKDPFPKNGERVLTRNFGHLWRKPLFLLNPPAPRQTLVGGRGSVGTKPQLVGNAVGGGTGREAGTARGCGRTAQPLGLSRPSGARSAVGRAPRSPTSSAEGGEGISCRYSWSFKGKRTSPPSNLGRLGDHFDVVF